MKPETLSKVRKANGYTMKAMAEHLQISRDTWRAYERGTRPVPMWLALAVTCIHHRFETLK